MKTLLATVVVLLLVGPATAAEFVTAPVSGTGTSMDRIHEYLLDDGSVDNALGLSGGDFSFWAFNQFWTTPGLELLEGIEISWGSGVVVGTELCLLVYKDPNNDGEMYDVTQADMIYYGTGQVMTSIYPDVSWDNYPVPCLPLGNVGDVFYMGWGISTEPASTWPGAFDNTAPQQRSWIAGGDPGHPCDDPFTAAIPPERPDNFGYPGNYMIRGNAGAATATEDVSWGVVKAAY
jgi:hypothetical protein